MILCLSIAEHANLSFWGSIIQPFKLDGCAPGWARSVRKGMTVTVVKGYGRRRAIQKATENRRLLAEVGGERENPAGSARGPGEAARGGPVATWPEAAEKARYLLGLFAPTAIAQDARRQLLIASVLKDFDRLSEAKGE